MPKDEFLEAVKVALRPVEQGLNADVILYVGDIYPPSDNTVLFYSKKYKRKPNILFILATRGGLPDSAYRIARALRNAYKGGRVIIFVHSICKSAGTLVTLGADELVMSDGAHLGPLDIQIQSREEVGEASSGLTQTQALTTLEEESWRLFSSHFAKLRFGSKYRFSTKMAAQISARITVGMFRPIYEQIDPLRLGENDRAMHIASEYGERLNKASKILKDRTLAKLIDGYPSHSFVIDREEANQFFKRVREPTREELSLMEELSYFIFDESSDDDEPGGAFVWPVSNVVGQTKGDAIRWTYNGSA